MISKDLQKILTKKFGTGVIAKASDAKALIYKRIPTGSMQLDAALGGGIPLGRIIEFAGPETHGKTTVLLKIIAENQQKGATCAFIDTEGSFDSTFAKKLGVNLKTLEFNAPVSQEAMIDLVEIFVASREVTVIGIDSITGPVPTHIQGRSAADPTMGVEAKLNNLFCRKVVTAMAPGDLTKKENQPWCAVIYTNQLRDTIGKLHGIPTGGGGWGLKFFKSIGVEFRRLNWLGKDGESIIATKADKWGQTISFVVKKNKTAIPHSVGEIDFYFKDTAIIKAGEYDLLKEAIITATKNNIIRQSGAYFYIGENSFQGMDNLVSAIRTDRGIVTYLEKQFVDEKKFWYFKQDIKRLPRGLVDEQTTIMGRERKPQKGKSKAGKKDS